MPSPFPGMDPYLEDPAGWSGVHLGLLYAIHAELNRVLPDGVRARMDQFVWVREDGESGGRRPDVFIPEPPPGTRAGAAVAEQVSAPTVRGTLPRGRKRVHRRVQIVTARGEQVLTVLEVVSPSNKAGGDDGEAYAQKRREYLGSVNFVEIDLLRAGGRRALSRPEPPTTDYYVFSCRAAEYPATAVWAFNVRDEFPVVPVPVSPKYPDAPLRLRAALDRMYDDGKYGTDTDYSSPPTPPLDRHDAEWAADLLKKHAKKRKP
jgi:hypothetical protein